MEHASKLEVSILDSISNDTECVASIWPQVKDEIAAISGRQLKETIYSLYQRGMVYIENETQPIEFEEIMAEETTNQYSNGNYYFGLTPAGVEFWENAYKEYGEPIDWSNSWTTWYDYKLQKGYVDGTSQEACLNTLIKYNQETREDFKDWQINMDSLVDSEIEGFQAKYYKYIPGGHRKSFKLKRR